MTKAQEQVLNDIVITGKKKRYDTSFYEEKLEQYKQANDQRAIEWAEQHMAMVKEGWILVKSYNSRTLRALEKLGYIEYKGQSDNPHFSIDWVRLLKT